MNEFNKPKTFRDRNKTHAKNSGDYGDKPKHQPYKRSVGQQYLDQVVKDQMDPLYEAFGINEDDELDD